jgi:hypothetical protein
MRSSLPAETSFSSRKLRRERDVRGNISTSGKSTPANPNLVSEPGKGHLPRPLRHSETFGIMAES